MTVRHAAATSLAISLFVSLEIAAATAPSARAVDRLVTTHGRAALVSVSSRSSTAATAATATAANGDSAVSAISASGRFVVFESRATDLVPGDTNGASDVFVHDRVTGVTERISVTSGGEEGNGESMSGSISADGRFVVFDSEAPNLVAGDTNKCFDPYANRTVNCWDVFVRDRVARRTTRVSVSSSGRQANGWSGAGAVISANGRFVAFVSTASNLVAADTNRCEEPESGTYSCSDVFVRDRVRSKTTRVSVSTTGRQADADSAGSAISADGRHVAFDSKASNLVAADTNRSLDVFVRDRAASTTERVSVSGSGRPSFGNSQHPTLSADGRYVAFVSPGFDLIRRPSSWHVYVRDRVRRVTALASINGRGKRANRDSLDPSISADGRFVAFVSQATNLVAGDTNRCVSIIAPRAGYSCWDVFVRDRATGRTTLISVSNSGRQANGDSGDPAISADGRFVAFDSAATNLVPGDSNTCLDDDGGFRTCTDVLLRDRASGKTTLVSQSVPTSR